MKQKLYSFVLELNWKLVNYISQVDRFDASWSAIKKVEGQSLKQLKAVATVQSIGASTRIEGSKLTDDEVDVLIDKMGVSKLEDRDTQEVAGYYDALNIIAESYKDIDITESSIKNLHNILLKHCAKDEWHRGNYKQHSNVVEATQPDGTKKIIFKTTEPGFATEDAMRKLIEWYNSDTETHPIVRSATLVYDFLSIHPFQDGNGRLSRLLTTLLLMKHGYTWIEYVSFEHEIENRKQEYYMALIQCQRERPGEDIYTWLIFFLSCFSNIQKKLMEKLSAHRVAKAMSPKYKKIYTFIESHPGCQSGEIAEKLDIPLPTIKKIISTMLAEGFITKYGAGAGTNYTV